MIVGVPAESHPDEHRVALIPAMVPTLIETGLEVLVEEGAGEDAGFPGPRCLWVPGPATVQLGCSEL